MNYPFNWHSANTGWICPICGRANAPFIPYCCLNKLEVVQTDSTTPLSKNPCTACLGTGQVAGMPCPLTSCTAPKSTF